MCVMFSRALDTLLMYHVSLGVIRIVTKCSSEHFGLNQKHVCGRACVVSRVPDASIAVLVELIVTQLKQPLARTGPRAGVEVALDLGDGHHHCQIQSV